MVELDALTQLRGLSSTQAAPEVLAARDAAAGGEEEMNVADKRHGTVLRDGSA